MDFATAEETLETPPIDWFSSQKITFADGSVADGSEVVEDTNSVTVPIESIVDEMEEMEEHDDHDEVSACKHDIFLD